MKTYFKNTFQKQFYFTILFLFLFFQPNTFFFGYPTLKKKKKKIPK